MLKASTSNHLPATKVPVHHVFKIEVLKKNCRTLPFVSGQSPIGKKEEVVAFVPNDGCLNYIGKNDEPLNA